MSSKKIVLTIIVLLVLSSLVYFIAAKTNNNSPTGNAVNVNLGEPSTNQETSTGAKNSQKVININAKRWEYDPSSVTVKKGDRVKFVITNEDTTHGIAIPDLGVSGIESLEFTADKVGTFQFRCPTMCGQGHRNMTGTLIVTE